jgi:hypothetical protein
MCIRFQCPVRLIISTNSRGGKKLGGNIPDRGLVSKRQNAKMFQNLGTDEEWREGEGQEVVG